MTLRNTNPDKKDNSSGKCEINLNSTSCQCKVEDFLKTVTPEETADDINDEDKRSIISERKFGKYTSKDPEISILFEYIRNVFERTVTKLELAVAVPLLMLDPRLPDILSKKELEKVKAAFSSDKFSGRCSVYVSPSRNIYQSASCVTIWPGTDDAISISQTNKSSAINSEIFDALQILNSCPAIREIVRSSRKDISKPSSLFLHHFRYFAEHVLSRMRLTPEEGRARDLRYRKLWREDKNSAEEIRKFTETLEKLRSDHRKSVEDMVTQYKRDMVAVEGINRKCAEDTKNTILRSERKQYFAYKASELKQNELKSMLANVKHDLDSLREENLKAEAVTRNKKFKVESKLQAVINKFDAEIGDRGRLMEELEEIYENDKKEKAALQRELDTQKEIHDKFVAKKELAVQKIFEEKLAAFRRERSAKLIQRWWRTIYPKLKKKKRRKKKKKGKKK